MDRRNFLKTTAVLAALGAVSKITGSLQAAAPAKKKTASGAPDIVVIRNGEPAEMFETLIKELGGMQKFVKPGQSVVIKPNIAWNQPPEMAANTHPELVAAVIRHCKAAGASKIYVFDTTCNFWKDTYQSSGIAEAAEKAGAIVVGGDSEKDPEYLKEYYSEVTIPNAKVLKKMMHHNLIRQCDVFINIPVLKVHGGAKLTCCMKNLMGTVSKGYQKYFHKHGLNQCIAECCSFRKPDLNIVDAYRVMTKRGPRGVDQSDVKLLRYQMGGTDMVALDTAGAKMLNVPLRRIGHIAIARSIGLGTTDLNSLNIKRINLNPGKK
ncbi:MAG: DUF362 domain-containing protein [Lentisphaeria bacterium]|nr:DUF362 domain-containing protein [Lentisphaeria bacterium]